jgi:hypothetical protein
VVVWFSPLPVLSWRAGLRELATMPSVLVSDDRAVRRTLTDENPLKKTDEKT